MALLAGARLALIGIAAAAIGVHETITGTQINVRLVGSLLLAAGVLLLAGAAGLLRRTPEGMPLAIIAALLEVAIGVMTFLAQAVNDAPD